MIPTVAEAIRVSRGLTQMSLASRAGVSQTAISLLETGHARTPAPIAAALSRTLDTSEALLTTPAPEVELLHAMKDAVRAGVRRRVAAEFILAFVRIQELAPGTRHTARHSGRDEGSPAVCAEGLRSAWQIPPGPVQNIVSTLESHGVVHLRRDLGGTRVNALVGVVGSHRAIMFVDPRAHYDDAAWNIAHELGHLALHASALPAQEGAAEDFAGEFLAPATEIRQLLSSGMDVDDLPAHFRVPPAKFARHARRRGVITVADHRRLRTHSRPPHEHHELPAHAMLAGIVDERTRAGETIEQVAASAFLTVNDLREDFI